MFYRSARPGDTEYLCKNCAVYTTQGKIPKIALCRGLMFPELPPELTGLSTIEQRLVSPRHEFMNIRSLGRERQQGLHGMVVNIPINTEQSVNQLPRNFSQSQTIQLQLFRKLSYAKPYLYETIRPRVVLEAARYLSTTELCKQQKVVLSEEWNSSVGLTDAVDFIVNPNDKLCTDTIPDEGDILKNETSVDAAWSDLFENIDEFLKEIDEWDETKNDLPINPGSLDTLLWSNDNMLLKLAPGEGKTPLNIVQDEFIEELAYPCVLAGVKRDLPEDLSILKKSKSDILRLVLFYHHV